MSFQLTSSFQSVPEAFFAIAKKEPNCVLYSQSILAAKNQSQRTWAATHYQTSADRVKRIAAYLLSLGSGAGKKIAILSNTRPEWCECDLAAMAIGATSVAIYHSLSTNDVGYILYDSGADIVFAENEEQVQKLIELYSHPFSIPEREGIAACEVRINFKKIIAIEKVEYDSHVVQLAEVLRSEPISDSALTKLLSQINADNLASLVYTSGTTGPPKGVMQSHANHLANVDQAIMSGAFAPEGSLFLFLPLAHSFARLIAYIGFITPAKISFPAVTDTRSSKADIPSILADLKSSGSEVVPTVPRVLEKIMSGIQTSAQQKSISGLLLKTCLSSALKVFRSKKDGKSPSILDQVIYLGTAAIRSKLKNKVFGGSFTHAISGGAKLPIYVNEFFDALGMPILEGYGLTETCVATNVNTLSKRKIGSVGPCLEGVIIKIEPKDGEILFKGPNITKGYYNRPAATAESWDSDGWFHTGDIGHIDADGYLFITDRKKDLIVSAGGKKIAPQRVEGIFKNSLFISQVVLYGDAMPYCVALITLDIQAVTEWLKGKQLNATQPYSKDKEIKELIKAEVERYNTELSNFETVKKFTIIDEDFTIENGLLTPTLKVKRKEVVKRYKDQIEELYAGG